MRTATASQHQDLEDLLDLLSPALDLQRLEAIMRCFAAFYSSLEASVDSAISDDLSVEIDWPSRRKMPTIVKDLALFGNDFSVAVATPTLTCDAEALGALYVVEGATLGGQLIGPHVSQLFPDHPVKLFSVYGDQAPQRWKSFRTVANERLIHLRDLEEAQQTAVQTFEQLAQTFERELAI